MQPFFPPRIAYTGGLDTLVRIWHTDQGEDQEPEAAYEADEGITTVAAAVRASPYTLGSPHLTFKDRTIAGSLEVTTLKCEGTYLETHSSMDWWRTLPERRLGL